MSTLLGGIIVAVAGLLMGSSVWPMKLMRTYRFEHWWFVGMLVGLIIIPWAVTLSFCPNAVTAYQTVGFSPLIKANLFAVGWGVANILCGLCFVRIGFALTGGIMTGLGASIGVTLPMVVKGSGLFGEAPNIGSPAGQTVLVGVTIMMIGVVLVSMAGFGRDRALRKADERASGGFLGGLVMVVMSGVLSAGISLAFVYSQGPVVSAMKARGASDIPANLAVWAAGLFGGAVINVAYPAYLMTKNKSWGVMMESGKEAGLAALIGVSIIVSVALMGKGMVFLGSLGASVGFGIQQAMQMLGSQGVGFISGEWRGVHGSPRLQICCAILILIIAALVMAYGSTLART